MSRRAGVQARSRRPPGPSSPRLRSAGPAGPGPRNDPHGAVSLTRTLGAAPALAGPCWVAAWAPSSCPWQALPPPVLTFLFSSHGHSLKLRVLVLPSPTGTPPPRRLPASPLFGAVPSSSAGSSAPSSESFRSCLKWARGGPWGSGGRSKREARPCVNSRGAGLSGRSPGQEAGAQTPSGEASSPAEHSGTSAAVGTGLLQRGAAGMGRRPDTSLRSACTAGGLAGSRSPARHVQWG